METVRIGSLEVMKAPLEKGNWEEANEACELLEDGWRLPNMKELNILFNVKELIKYKEDKYYWSCETEGISGRCLCISDGSTARDPNAFPLLLQLLRQ